jgi:hypothetical protein
VFRAKDDRFFGPFTMAQTISLGLVVAGILASQYFRRPRGGTQVAMAGAR